MGYRVIRGYSYRCQSCGLSQFFAENVPQSRYPRCPGCGRYLCKKCMSNMDSCRYCFQGLPESIKTRIKGLKVAKIIFCIIYGIGMIIAAFSLGIMVSPGLMVPVVFLTFIILDLLTFAWAAAFEQAIKGTAKRAIAKYSSENVNMALQDYIKGILGTALNQDRCPRCGGELVETYVVDKRTGRRMRTCMNCGIMV